MHQQSIHRRLGSGMGDADALGNLFALGLTGVQAVDVHVEIEIKGLRASRRRFTCRPRSLPKQRLRLPGCLAGIIAVVPIVAGAGAKAARDRLSV